MSIKIEEGLSVVKLHIKNWRGSELKANAELPENDSREIARALYVAQTGNVIDADKEMCDRLMASCIGDYPEAREIFHRLQWLSRMNNVLAEDIKHMRMEIEAARPEVNGE